MKEFLESGGWILFVIAFFALIFFLAWLFNTVDKAGKYDRLKPRLDRLDAYGRQLEAQKEANSRQFEARRRQIEVNRTQVENYFKSEREVIETLAKEKGLGFPWLATAYADYFYLQDLKKAKDLQSKSHPAPKAAEQVREIASQRRIAERLHRILRYQLEYYEKLFPWLVDFKGDDLDELIKQILEKRERGSEDLEEPDDAAKKWLTEAEYEKLPQVEKYQLALDRYWQKKKSKWEVGRDYERYIGYLYEKASWGVYYQGIIEGLSDLGRDLVCVKDNKVEIVQCKYWSQDREIHEKHVFQLYGTVVAYKIEHSGTRPMACLITSTTLSPRAKDFAAELDIRVNENLPLNSYPSIKCNVSRRDGIKIYHLPFDQQYDKTLMEEERHECYVSTVKEAERLGFRRAFRWRGETSVS